MNNVVPFPEFTPILTEYQYEIRNLDRDSIDVYMRTLRQYSEWLAERPGSGGRFQPELMTQNSLETYINELADMGYSISHRNRVKTVVGKFAKWIIEEKGVLRKNPATGIVIPPQGNLAPRELSPDQRYVLKNLVERVGDQRGAAMFALGYWAGCRASDVTWLLREKVSIGPKIGMITIGHKAKKERTIYLRNEARGPLYDYLNGSERKIPDSPFVFTSERSERLTENGLHRWFSKLKNHATKDEWELIADVTFHHLRHDFAHRARDAEWSLEEVAVYLGHIRNNGTPAIQSTARYTQPTFEKLRKKLGEIKG